MKSKFRSLIVIVVLIIALQTVNNLSAEIRSLSIQYVEVIMYNVNGSKLNNIVDLGCSIERMFTLFNMVLARCPRDTLTKVKDYGLNAIPNFNLSISIIFKDFKIYDFYSLSQSLDETPYYWSWAVSRVSADISWSYLGEDGSNTIIAILDTGVDSNHPLLKGKIIAWAEFDSKGRPICSQPRDIHGHGTWVASIVAGGDGKRYVFGVAPNAKLMVASVLPYGYGTVAQVLAGLEWVLEPYDICTKTKLNIKPNVVSMSFGAPGNYSNVFLPAIKKLIENGIVAVAAIGNSGPYTSSNPGNIWGVIGVGAIDFNNNVTMFSSYEDVEWPDPPADWPFKGGYPKQYRKPDVVAPGVDIPGAFPGGLIAIGSGTSASTPIVAGLAAIISTKLRDRGFSGSRLVEAVYDVIISSTTLVSDRGAGNGLVDFYRAIAKAKNINVKVINVKTYPSTARPLSSITISLEGVELGDYIEVYISGSKVFSNTISSRYLTVSIPLTHADGNTITVVGSKGAIYGKTLIQIIPSILLGENMCQWGKLCRILVSGLGIGDTLIVYLENNIMTLGPSNLRGSFDATFITPLAEEGYYNITVVDLSRPGVTLYARVYIIKPSTLQQMLIINTTHIIVKNQTLVETINNIYVLPIYVGVKQYYVANTVDFIDVCIHGGTIDYVEINKVVSTSLVDIRILNISQIDYNVYRIWFSISSLDAYEVYAIINITISLNSIKTPYLILIRILSEDPYKVVLNSVEQLSKDLRSNTSLLHGLIDNINSLENSMKNIDSRVNTLNNYVNELKEESSIIKKDVDGAAKQLRQLQIITLIAVALGIISIGLNVVFVIGKIKH
ncbi:MAG: S8 family serine peptidase [Ignisphaera sp.]